MQMTALAVSSAVEVDAHKRTVVIPKVSPQDFGPAAAAAVGKYRNSSSSTPASPLECLRSLLSYVRRDDKATILKMISGAAMGTDNGGAPGSAGLTGGGGAGPLVVRMKTPSLRCRTLQILLTTTEGGGSSEPVWTKIPEAALPAVVAHTDNEMPLLAASGPLPINNRSDR
jgi:hypothetical protein